MRGYDPEAGPFYTDLPADAAAAVTPTRRRPTASLPNDQQPQVVDGVLPQNNPAAISPRTASFDGYTALDNAAQTGREVTGKLNANFFPGTRAALSGSGEDIANAVSKGNYGAALGHIVRGALGASVGAVDDVVGGAARGAYGALAGPATSFAGAVTGRDFNTPGTTVAPNATVAPDAANPTDQRLGAGTQGAPTSIPGDAVAGADGVRKFTDANGGVTYSNTGSPDFNDGRVSTIGGGAEGAARNLRAADIYASMRQGQDQAAGGGSSYIPGVNAPKTQYEQETAARNASFVSPSRNSRHAEDIASRESVANRENATRIATTKMINDTTARGQDLTYGAAIHGQESTARTAANAARLDQMNKDRQYNFDEKKFGADQAAKMFDQRQQAEKDNTAKLQSMYTTIDPKTGQQVVDHAAVAAHTQATNDLLGEKISKLSAIPPSSPDYAAAQATMKEISAKGASLIDNAKNEEIRAGLLAKQRIAASHSTLNPFGGSFIDSPNPDAYRVVGTKKGMFQDQYVTANGSTVPTRALDYSQGGGAILPNSLVDTPTTQFDILKRGARNAF